MRRFRIRGRRRIPRAPRRIAEIRLPTKEGALIRAELAKPLVRGCERSVLALIGLAKTTDHDCILVRQVVPIPDEAYFPMREGAAWSPLVTGQALSQGMRLGAGLLLIHAHPGSKAPRLSITDHVSFQTLLPRCIDLLPNRPHGSIVLGNGGAIGGLIWLPGRPPTEVVEVGEARWLKSPVVRHPQPPRLRPRRFAIYDRQEMLIGPDGQSLLSQTTLGVVGLGGGGSHIVQQAAHMGFGRLILIDPDRVEDTNLSRLVGAGPSDTGRLKTEVMEDLVRRVNPDVTVDTCAERFPSAAAIESVKECDILVSALDSYTARAEVQKVAWRFLIPLIDIGLGIRVNDDGALRRAMAIAGHMHVYLPGGPCMWCSDLVTEEKLSEERGGNAVPYVVGVSAPQVIHFNGLLASQAMVEAMQLVTGFIDDSERTGFLTYRGMRGEVVQAVPSRRPDCSTCATELGAGDTVW